MSKNWEEKYNELLASFMEQIKIISEKDSRINYLENKLNKIKEALKEEEPKQPEEVKDPFKKNIKH